MLESTLQTLLGGLFVLNNITILIFACFDITPDCLKNHITHRVIEGLRAEHTIGFNAILRLCTYIILFCIKDLVIMALCVHSNTLWLFIINILVSSSYFSASVPNIWNTFIITIGDAIYRSCVNIFFPETQLSNPAYYLFQLFTPISNLLSKIIIFIKPNILLNDEINISAVFEQSTLMKLLKNSHPEAHLQLTDNLYPECILSLDIINQNHMVLKESGQTVSPLIWKWFYTQTANNISIKCPNTRQPISSAAINSSFKSSIEHFSKFLYEAEQKPNDYKESLLQHLRQQQTHIEPVSDNRVDIAAQRAHETLERTIQILERT